MPPVWLVLYGDLVFWAAAVAAIVAAWGVERAVRRWRMHRSWRTRTRAFERGDARAPVGSVVRLDGMLRIEGTGARAFEDGGPVAASTAVARAGIESDGASVSVRAAKLWLDTAEGSVALVGPIEVVTGRTTRLATAPFGSTLARIHEALGDQGDWPFTELAVELRSIAARDRVEIAGRLEQALDQAAAYRDRAARPILVGEGGALLAHRREARPARSWRAPLMVAVSLLLSILPTSVMVRGWPLEWLHPLARARARDVLGYDLRLQVAVALGEVPGVAPREALALRLALLPPEMCPQRARTLRAGGDVRAALREAERCNEPAALREQTLALFALGRERDAMRRWRALVEAVDEDCARGRPCDTAMPQLSSSPTWLAWLSIAPSQLPEELLLGVDPAPESPGLARRLVAVFDEASPQSAPLRQLHVAWTLELARFELEVGELDEARRRIEHAELLAARGVEPRFGEDIEHMRGALASRWQDLFAVEEIVADRTFGEDYERLGLLRSTEPSSLRPYLDEHGAWRRGALPNRNALEVFVRYTADHPAVPLPDHLEFPLTRSSHAAPSVDDLLHDAALARALDIMDRRDEAAAARALVRRGRGHLLALPPLERYR